RSIIRSPQYRRPSIAVRSAVFGDAANLDDSIEHELSDEWLTLFRGYKRSGLQSTLLPSGAPMKRVQTRNSARTDLGSPVLVLFTAWLCLPAPAAQPPSITTQPLSQTVAAGTNVTFGVTASGPQPLMYQWRFNGAARAGATNRVFKLSHARCP